MLTFLAIDGLIFIVVLVLVELRVWEKILDLICSFRLIPTTPPPIPGMYLANIIPRINIPASIIIEQLLIIADPENGVVLLVEDDDVARERELLHSKPVHILQMDNNLIIKYILILFF